MSPSPLKQATLIISGKVQGVFFRSHAAEENIQAFIEWAKKGSPSARVEKVEVKWSEPSKSYEDFRIY